MLSLSGLHAIAAFVMQEKILYEPFKIQASYVEFRNSTQKNKQILGCKKSLCSGL
jgi:hypothetical protein